MGCDYWCCFCVAKSYVEQNDCCACWLLGAYHTYLERNREIKRFICWPFCIYYETDFGLHICGCSRQEDEMGVTTYNTLFGTYTTGNSK